MERVNATPESIVAASASGAQCRIAVIGAAGTRKARCDGCAGATTTTARA